MVFVKINFAASSHNTYLFLLIMFTWLTFTVFCLIGFICCREANDIDTNRIHLLPKEPAFNTHERLFDHGRRTKSNDHDDHISGNIDSQTLPTAQASSVPIKVHQSKQDPRLFYQSDSYIREVERKDLDRDVTFIYPEMIRSTGSKGPRACIKCPHDMTLVAKPGSDRVVLQHPRIYTCSGRKTHKNTWFEQMYGPKFGTLVQEGSHMIIGRIIHKGQSLHLCKMQIHVVTQGCITPKYLISQCGDNQVCNFTCRNTKLEMHGKTSLTCDSHIKWTGALPICKARTWCDPPSPPDHGHMTCKSASASNTRTAEGIVYSLAEGSRCRVKCARGWHRSPRAFTVCRRGAWTHTLTCLSNRNSS